MDKKQYVVLNNKLNEPLVNEFALLVKQVQFEMGNKDLTKQEKTKYQFKLKHFKNALSILRQYPDKITKGEDLKDVSGIGKGIMERIDEFLSSKKISEIDKEKIKEIKKDSDILDELSQVINIGPSVAKQLIDKHKIKSVEDLKKKVKNNEIDVNDKIKIGLKYYGVVKEKIPRKEIDNYDIVFQEELKNIKGFSELGLILTIAGSYRRQKETSNDIDILISAKNIPKKKDYEKMDRNILTEFLNNLKKRKILVDNLTDFENTTKYMGFSKLPRKPVRRLDVRFVPFESYYYALLYFTGSYELNREMRTLARQRGYKLNEYGLYKIKEDDTTSNTSKKVNSEKDIFKVLKMDYLEPNERG